MSSLKTGDLRRFSKPGILGTRPVVRVLNFNQVDKQVQFCYQSAPSLIQSMKSDQFLDIYDERMN